VLSFILLLNNINLYFTIFYQNLLIYIRDAALEAAAEALRPAAAALEAAAAADLAAAAALEAEAPRDAEAALDAALDADLAAAAALDAALDAAILTERLAARFADRERRIARILRDLPAIIYIVFRKKK